MKMEVIINRHLGMPVYTLSIDGMEHRLPVNRWNRNVIINALVRHRYSQDEVEAITNNYLEQVTAFMDTFRAGANPASVLSEIDESKHKTEYEELQSWRQQCKEIADELLIQYPPLQ